MARMSASPGRAAAGAGNAGFGAIGRVTPAGATAFHLRGDRLSCARAILAALLPGCPVSRFVAFLVLATSLFLLAGSETAAAQAPGGKEEPKKIDRTGATRKRLL